VLEVSHHARRNVLSVPWETAENPEAPALFPYGSFGSLLVSGERSRDGQTFFARRIVAFLPQLRRRRFRVALRRCDFYDDRAVYRDVRRKIESWLDRAAAVWQTMQRMQTAMDSLDHGQQRPAAASRRIDGHVVSY
jgi:hypothetical protein